MDDERMVKRMFLGNPGGRRKPVRPRLRWLDCVEDDLKTLRVRRWRKRAEDCEERDIILKEAMVKLQELYVEEQEEGEAVAYVYFYQRFVVYFYQRFVVYFYQRFVVYFYQR
jgi:hypothetical protein